MDASSLYGESFMDHVANPDYKYELDAPTLTQRGVNPSCGDDLTLAIRLGDDGTIEEAAYTGSGCAVSQASADMMSDLVIGKTPLEARRLCQLFGQMIRGEQNDVNLLERELDEASSLRSISRMPARVKCAELAWNTLDEMLSSGGEDL